MQVIKWNKNSRNRLRNVINARVQNDTKRVVQENQLLIKHYMDSQLRMMEMNDSLRYAHHLQNAMLPGEARLRELAGDAFMLNIPRNTLSGDFCWCSRNGSQLIIAVADCTGHGVPGALMSILGLNLLNRAVIDEGLTDPSEILYAVDSSMQQTFARNGDNTAQHGYDGMDIGLCVIDTEKKLIHFAGAMRPLFIVKNGELTEVTGSRFPIGGLRLDIARNFQQHVISYSTGDQIFLFSDGYTDQFGGPNGKKFSRERMRKLVQSASAAEHPDERKQQFHECHILWRGDVEQTDDMLVVGVKL
ncbi:MAG: PP2C family protein-serine/threonine phosphatase, partial [Bacteroidia bacterium]